MHWGLSSGTHRWAQKCQESARGVGSLGSGGRDWVSQEFSQILQVLGCLGHDHVQLSKSVTFEMLSPITWSIPDLKDCNQNCACLLFK
jgi:hypothetical protein